MLRARIRRHRLLALAGVVLAVELVGLTVAKVMEPRRTTPVYRPPVVAGQQAATWCAGGFYARRGDTVVLTSSGHCAREGDVAWSPDGTVLRGVFGPRAIEAACPHAGKECLASDMSYIVVAPDQVPWGHLDQVDLGTGGYRTVPPGTRPLSCADIAIGDPIEIDGRNTYRTGTVAEKGDYLHDGDGTYFPCMVAARVDVMAGDSGGAVLVRGIPAGVISRSFGGPMGFTPLAEGLANLGLQLCTSPDCGLAPPPSASALPSAAVNP